MKARELFRRAEAKGWKRTRTEGSHHIFTKDGRHVSIPGPANNEVPAGTVRNILQTLEED